MRCGMDEIYDTLVTGGAHGIDYSCFVRLSTR